MQASVSRRRCYDIVNTEVDIDRLPQPYRFINKLLQRDILIPLETHIEQDVKTMQILESEERLRNFEMPQFQSTCSFNPEKDLIPYISSGAIDSSITEFGDVTKSEAMQQDVPKMNQNVKKDSKAEPKKEIKGKEVNTQEKKTESIVEVSTELDSIIDCLCCSGDGEFAFIITRLGRLAVLNSSEKPSYENENSLEMERVYIDSKLIYDIQIRKEDIKLPEEFQDNEKGSTKNSSLKASTTPKASKTNINSQSKPPKTSSGKREIERNVELKERYIEEEYEKLTKNLQNSPENFFSICVSANLRDNKNPAYLLVTSNKFRKIIMLHIYENRTRKLHNIHILEKGSIAEDDSICRVFISDDANFLSIAFRNGTTSFYKVTINSNENEEVKWIVTVDLIGSIPHEIANNLSCNSCETHVYFLRKYSLQQEISEMNQIYKIYDFNSISKKLIEEVLIWCKYSKKIQLCNLNNLKQQRNLLHLDRITSVAIDESTETLCTGSEKGNLTLWDLRVGFMKTTLTKHEDSITHILFHKYFYLISASNDKAIFIHDLKNFSLLRSINYYKQEPCIDGIASLNVLPFIICATKNFVDIVDIVTGKGLCTLSQKSLKQMKHIEQAKKKEATMVEYGEFVKFICNTKSIFMLRKHESARSLPFKNFYVYYFIDILATIYPELAELVKKCDISFSDAERFLLSTEHEQRSDKSVIDKFMSMPTSLLTNIQPNALVTIKPDQFTTAEQFQGAKHSTKSNGSIEFITLSELKQQRLEKGKEILTQSMRIRKIRQVIESDRVERKKRIVGEGLGSDTKSKQKITGTSYFRKNSSRSRDRKSVV